MEPILKPEPGSAARLRTALARLWSRMKGFVGLGRRPPQLPATRDPHQDALRLEHALSRYLPRDLAHALARGDAPPASQRCHVTVLFCDMRGFTFLCERERPEDVVALLNIFYERASAIIEFHGGTINKLLGDGLLALFGAPVALPAHADAAADSALELLDLVRDLRELGGVWTHLAIGVGIDTGDVVVGPIGSAARQEYTAIGSAVNRAARLQGLAEREHQRVLISEATKRALAYRHRPTSLGLVTLKGFATPEQVFYLSPPKQIDDARRDRAVGRRTGTSSSGIRMTPVTEVSGLARLQDLTDELTRRQISSEGAETTPFNEVTGELTPSSGEPSSEFADSVEDTGLHVSSQDDNAPTRINIRSVDHGRGSKEP